MNLEIDRKESVDSFTIRSWMILFPIAFFSASSGAFFFDF